MNLNDFFKIIETCFLLNDLFPILANVGCRPALWHAVAVAGDRGEPDDERVQCRLHRGTSGLRPMGGVRRRHCEYTPICVT